MHLKQRKTSNMQPGKANLESTSGWSLIALFSGGNVLIINKGIPQKVPCEKVQALLVKGKFLRHPLSSCKLQLSLKLLLPSLARDPTTVGCCRLNSTAWRSLLPCRCDGRICPALVLALVFKDRSPVRDDQHGCRVKDGIVTSPHLWQL